ncbi:aminotransferase class III-fold pyridoxal phosphate-dependent enzyme [Anaerolineales bacterium]
MSAFDLLSPVWSHLTHLQPDRGEGIYLYADGKEYIDFTSGIGVTNTGHCHPRVVKAIQAQAAKLIFGQANIVISRPLSQLAEKVNAITPPEINAFFFSNSGAEAVEAAVKLARHATGRPNVIVFQGGFHGRTAQTMSMTTAKTIYREGYQPLPAGVFVAPFPYTYGYGWDEETTVDFCLKELKRLLKMQSTPEETAAMVIEPILGEGGYVPAPKVFLQALRKLADETGILLVMDEVQTGFGRTGTYFNFEQAEIVPDIIIMAKGLGSGLPISGIASRLDLMERWKTGTHGGTYAGGSAIALAAAIETIAVLEEERLLQNAQDMGQYLVTRLQDLQKRYDFIGDVRGQGLMVATEFTRDGEADKVITKKVQKACLDDQLLLLTCGPAENVIRWIPPLIVNREQMDKVLSIFEKALATI